MSGGTQPFDGSGVRRRRSGEQEERADGVVDLEHDGIQNGIRAMITDSGPITEASGTSDRTGTRRASSGGSSRIQSSAEVEIRISTTAGKKRKSDEITRDTGGLANTPANPGLAVDSHAPNTASTNAGDNAPATQSSNSLEPPIRNLSPRHSPMSPKSRSRGMSLRSSLFARNMDPRPQTEDSIMEMRNVGSSSTQTGRPDSDKKDCEPIVTASPVLTRLLSHVPYSPSSPHLTRVPSKTKGLQGVSALPNYQQWVQKRANRHLPIRRIKESYDTAQKFMLRIQEVPPSKDGRHIPLGPSRKKALTDHRTGHPFVSNFIKSSKYTVWNFLPRQLFAQFSKLANAYFLVVSILQMIPGLSTTGSYTTIVPLLLFVSISMAKEGYEDFRRHKLDKAENNREAKVLHACGPVPTAKESEKSVEADGPIHWASVKWQSLQVGDIVRLERDEAAPADIILLDSKCDNGLAYIETMALDGETNLKAKEPSAALVGACKTPAAITALEKTELVVEDPNLDLYNFEGKITVNGGDPAPLTNTEMIYRGSVLRNTQEVYGLIIYSGEECKIRMNANKNPRIKAPSLQAIVNKIVVCMVVFVVALSLFNSIAYTIWSSSTEEEAWYLTHAKVPFGHILTSFIIMFNTMIPLSLYVSLEIIKVAQMVLLNDIDMYDEVSNKPFEARTSTINEELGQVSYVFSDKTGTLTENVMRFRKLSVAGTAWLHDADLQNQAAEDELLLHKKRKVKGKDKVPLRQPSRKSTSQVSLPVSGAASSVAVDEIPRKSTNTWRSAAATKVGPELSTTHMIRYIQRRPHTAFASKARMLVLSMALCHTCSPERGDTEDDISYQASSPDELALVDAARELGYLVFDRQASKLTIKTHPNGLISEPVVETYEILDVIEFSSKRKRMSVVVRFPDGRVCVICKGADSVIMERLRLATLASQKVAEIEKRVDARRSIEAQHAIHRKSINVDRQGSVGSFPRTSLSLARPSIVRPSIGRLPTIRDNIDGWLQEKESDVASPIDASQYSPRPSVQIGRSSAALSGHASSLHSEMEDDALVEEALVVDDAAVIERCFQHVHDFATTGLRTLLYGYRFLDKKEYRSWKKVYQDAITSLLDRQKMIEEAGEIIEQQLELGGATAIEDKLQKGVPETIDRLRRANIKMWMLTGDKRETAINIGHSCRLIKEYSSTTVLDYEAGGVEQNIAATIVDINHGRVAHAVVVIDGHTLGMIEADKSLHTLFLDLAILADSVICCRASPSQKAGLVHAIRRRVNRSVTLAIGDGANDIAMIQEAHVGIGITGKEGLQAARTSDYSIAQFRFLTKLLLVHGRWNYIRTTKYTVATFWKEMLFYLTQALYQRWNGYTGTSLYEQWSLSIFNTLFTSLPVIFLGIFEKDLAASTLIAVPELYTKGQRSGGFNFRVYLSWMFMAAAEAMVVFFTMKGLFGRAIFTPGKDLFAMGDMTYTACIVVINTKLQLLEQRNRSVMALICMVVEIGGWFLWNITFSLVYKENYEYNVKWGLLNRFGRNLLWWLVLVLTVVSCLLFEIGVRTVKNAVFPTDVEIFQELERDLGVRRRFEEASADQLQAGWHHGTNRSSMELQREAEAQAKREGEVQDLLNKPRIMEEGRSSQRESGILETKEQAIVVEDGPLRCSNDIQEMLSRRFGSIRRESLAQP